LEVSSRLLEKSLEFTGACLIFLISETLGEMMLSLPPLLVAIEGAADLLLGFGEG